MHEKKNTILYLLIVFTIGTWFFCGEIFAKVTSTHTSKNDQVIGAPSLNYDVKFEGVNKNIVTLLQSVSQLVLLENHPPGSNIALRRRAEADIPNILEALHSLAHYEAKVKIDINTELSPIHVIVNIDPGPVYPLSSFEIIPAEDSELYSSRSIEPLFGDAKAPGLNDQKRPNITNMGSLSIVQPRELSRCPKAVNLTERSMFPYHTISLQELDVILTKPALPKTILKAEKLLLRFLAKKGYPLATIQKRDVFVDILKKEVSVKLYVNSGPLARFGEITLTGLKKVHSTCIDKKIQWRTGGVYDPALIEGTQSAIEASGLFGSAIITLGEEVDEEGFIPVFIEVRENRHRSIGFGASYNTQLGLGITADWEHRNVRNLGEKVSLRTDLWEKLQRGVFLYRKPDFCRPAQDFLWILEAEREVTKGFTESFISASGIIERQMSENTKISYGGSFKQLDSEDSNNNGSFTLFKTPFQMKRNTANNLLDPTHGNSMTLRVTPTFQVKSPQIFYCINNFIATAYRTLDSQERWVIASKVNLGSIIGESNKEIPPPERFYAGSENTLRGYSYLTVSPLDKHRKPIGGRSLMIYSLELRLRMTEKIGWMGFYEVGNVYKEVLPRFDHKQLQSVGFGLRYHTAVGPLRLDFAFPLNRRKGLDKHFQFYFSIGQAF